MSPVGLCDDVQTKACLAEKGSLTKKFTLVVNDNVISTYIIYPSDSTCTCFFFARKRQIHRNKKSLARGKCRHDWRRSQNDHNWYATFNKSLWYPLPHYSIANSQEGVGIWARYFLLHYLLKIENYAVLSFAKAEIPLFSSKRCVKLLPPLGLSSRCKSISQLNHLSNTDDKCATPVH